MDQHPKIELPQPPISPNGRPTIGFLSGTIVTRRAYQMWYGVIDVAQKRDINVISLMARDLDSPIGFEAQANALYNLISADRLDGLLVWSSPITNTGGPAETKRILDPCRSIPIVAIQQGAPEDIPRVVLDSYGSMRALVVHLIETHGLRRIAFIRGPDETNRGAQERYQAYTDVLAEYDLPFDPNLVSPPTKGRWDESVGDEAVALLCDERQVDFDAIVGTNDSFAKGAINALQAREINVPGQVAVVGIDDEDFSSYLTPPLTTASLQSYELGRQGVEMLLALIEGQEVPPEVTLPANLIIRQSCGCTNPIVAQAESGPITVPGKPSTKLTKAQQNKILAEVRQAVPAAFEGVSPVWVEQLLTALVADLKGKSPENFLSILNEILHQVMVTDGQIEMWQQVILALRRSTMPYVSGGQVEDLWLQAQLMVGEVIQRVLGYQALQDKQQINMLNKAGLVLVTTLDVDELMNFLADELPRLGIPGCYLSLYEKPQQPAGQAKLLLAFDERGRLESQVSDRRFAAPMLIPSEILPQKRRYSYVVESLYFQNEQIGFVVFDAESRDGAIYEFLRTQISSALKGALLFEEAQQARLAAEKADRIKTRLLANVSHELRTPLNIILGYSHDVLKTPEPYGIIPPPALLDDHARIYKSAKHQLRVVNDLLDLSRAEIDELDLYLELLDPHPLLQDAFRSIADSTPTSTLAWRLQLPERLPLIQVDPVRLRQILLNLLSNAHKFTDQGEIVLGAQVEPPHLHLWVQDSGEGISLDMQARIFEPFVTTENARRRSDGIGLGLSITRRLVALHGGSMQLESQPGQGSTFHVYLPLPNLDDKTVPVTAPTEPVLLLITATAQPAAEIAALSQRQGLSLHRLRAGDDLGAILSQVQPAALVWDLVTASNEEWALVRRIRNHPHLSQLPFILYGQGEKTAQGVIGLTSVVTKPVTAPTLLETLEALQPQEMAGPILIVDDDPVARQAHQQMIAQGLPGYPLQVVNDGAAALAAMEDQTPSLVLLDLMMPELDGFDVLDQMRTNPYTLAVPVVILTSKVLNLEDIQRIERHTRVVLHSKGVLVDEEVVAALHRSLFGDEALPPQTSILVKRAVAYLHQNYARPLKRWEVADAVGASKGYLSRLFKQELGLSLWDYLNRFRVSQAKELFRRTQGSVKVVANQVGFKDPDYFSRVFRKLTGLSPSEFREQPKP